MNPDLPAPPRRVAILGLGLVGGSLALALRGAFAGTPLAGFDPDPAARTGALARGAVDEAPERLGDALRGADRVILATPVGAMEGLLAAMAPLLEPGCLVTDCASTKAQVARWAASHLPGHLGTFVPGHPVAGSEASGIQAADPDLFRGSQAILCPLPGTSREAVEGVAGLWRACGAEVRLMSPGDHDRAYAALSHLPQLLVSTLVRGLARRPGGRALLDLAGPGFRGLARLAGSSPVMWRDICLTNREALLQELRAYREGLAGLEGLLEAGDGPALEGILGEAREAWLAAGIHGPAPGS